MVHPCSVYLAQDILERFKEIELMDLTKVAWLLIVLSAVMLITGCAPGPPPPLPPWLFGAGTNWIAMILLVWISLLLWKNLNINRSHNQDHLTEALNAINDRLTVLEEKIQQLERYISS